MCFKHIFLYRAYLWTGLFSVGNLRYMVDGLAYSCEDKKKICVTVLFLLCFTLCLKTISKYKPPGPYI